MHNFKKAIIALDGSSSKITDKSVLINIRYALRSLGIPFEVYKPHKEGFKRFYADMNREDTLYILNDSLQFHLCEKPHVVIVRSAPWVQCCPKSSTIGMFCQEMVGHDASQLMACIAKNRPMRQHHDLNAATTYILVNEYQTQDVHTMGRYGLASFSWSKLISLDVHATVMLHTSEGWPKLNEMLHEGIQCFTHPDDLLIIINRDICLVPEATGIIRTHMDTHHLDAVYAKRVDLETERLLGFGEIKDMPGYAGIDLFVFRPNAPCVADIINVPLKLGRAAWDNFWADRVEHKLPYNVCYHLRHTPEWVSPQGAVGNAENLSAISKHSKPHYMSFEHYEGYFEDVK